MYGLVTCLSHPDCISEFRGDRCMIYLQGEIYHITDLD